MHKIEQVITRLEDIKLPFVYFVLTALFAVTLRNFLEIFSDWTPPSISTVLEYNLFYIALVLVLITLFRIVTKENVIKIAKVILSASIIVVIAPVIDLIVSRGKGIDISYLMPEVHGNILSRFLTFFGDFPGQGISVGMRIEISLVLLGCLVYFVVKGVSILRALVSTFAAYTLIFTFIAMPYPVLSFLSLLGVEPPVTTSIYINFYLLIIFVTWLALFSVHKREHFLALLKDIRPKRVLHYIALFFVSIFVTLSLKNKTITLTEWNFYDLFFVPIAIGLAWLFAVITNNIIDIKSDKGNSRSNALLAGTLTRRDYINYAWWCFFGSLVYALAAGIEYFFLVLLFITSYFVYSLPPLKLKRIPFFSKLPIAIANLAIVMMGWHFAQEPLVEFPKPLALLFILLGTALLNFIDIKDYAGDKKAGIKTLPVVLGLRASKLLISLFMIAPYWVLYCLTKQYIWMALLFSVAMLVVVNKRHYNENLVFL
ncbi:hypothetical protein DRJ48_03055, partial [Candidatus Woesearchaeota archaeon]